MCSGRSPYIKLAHILDYVVDILHLMLRAIPQIFKFTVSKDCDAAKLEQLVLWIEKQLKVELTNNKPGQSKTCTRKIDLSAKSWPGDTCQRLLDNFVDILRRPIPLRHGRDMWSYQDALKVWTVFFCLNYIVTHGCDDKDDPADVLAHAVEVEARGNEFLTALLQVASQKDVPVYIHAIAVHLRQMIRRHGSLEKWCSQGLEALHQWAYFFGCHRSNNRGQLAATLITKKVTIRQRAPRESVLNVRGPAHRDRAQKKKACVLLVLCKYALEAA
eukprot:jgi/Tetstr1/430533/TSEL_020331.t1